MSDEEETTPRHTNKRAPRPQSTKNVSGFQAQTVEQDAPIPYEVLDAPDGDGHLLIVHKDYGVDVNGGPRSGIREHRFDDVAHFAEWLLRHGEGDTAEVLVDESEIRAVMDPSPATPEIVSCALTHTPEFSAWCDVFEEGPLSQRRAAEFIRGWKDTIAEVEPLLTAIRSVKILRGGDYTSEIDETGATRIRGSSDKAELQVKVPSEINVSVAVFEGVVDPEGGPMFYDLSVLVSVDVDQMTFGFACPALAMMKRVARRGVVHFMASELGEEWLVGLGKLVTDTRPVEVGRQSKIVEALRKAREVENSHALAVHAAKPGGTD